MGGQYIYDQDKAKFRKETVSAGRIARRVLRFFLGSLSLALLYYAVFALFFSTDLERRLKSENRDMENILPELEEKEALLSDVIDGLHIRDNRIYEEIFRTTAPSVDPMSSLEFLSGLDTIPDDEIVRATASKIARLEASSDRIEENFKEVAALMGREGFKVPPMTMPLKNVTSAQIGASTGEKTNPFYKVPVMHNGLDVIASSGDPVYAAAAGTVADITRSRKGLGNVVTLSHRGGFKTRYAHLADIDVAEGRPVKAGERIGTVGTSGNSFAPHLHYEVYRDSVVLNPVNHFFATIAPEDYVNMLIMSTATGQSLD